MSLDVLYHQYNVWQHQTVALEDRVVIDHNASTAVYWSTLSAYDLMFADTGYYSCSYEERSGLSKQMHTAEIYAFISGEK